MDATRPLASLAGRILIAAIFVWSGYGKIVGYAGTQAYMAAHGLPGILLPLVILLELGGGILILLGWQTRIVAALFVVFNLAAALLFHADLADQGQAINFMKNVAIAGGFLFLVAFGPGAWSLDGRRA